MGLNLEDLQQIPNAAQPTPGQGLTLDHNGKLDGSLISAVVGPVFNVRDYKAIGDGSSDDTTAINSAIAAAVSKGTGIIYFPPGTYKVVSTLTTISLPTISLEGAGAKASIIQHNGTAGCFVIQPTFTVDQAGHMRGLTVKGTASAAGAGVYLREATGFLFDDVVIRDFTHASGVGLQLDNVVNWTERTTAYRLHLDNNTKGLRFTVNGGNTSFGFGKWLDTKINVNSAQIGISVEGTASVYSNEFVVSVNVGGGVGNTASVITLAGTGQLYGHGAFYCEQTTGTGAQFLTCPASTTFGGDFYIAQHTLARTLGGNVFLGASVPILTLTVNGPATIDASQLSSNSTGAGTSVVFLQANATSSSITNPSTGQILTIVWLQDGTGGRTVVWPANVFFAGGVAPAQASASKRTTLTVYYDGSNWFETSRAVNVG